MKYGDAVVVVQKQSDGALRRTNAIVLASSLHVPVSFDGKPLKDDAGELLPVEEHLDLAFPVASLVPEGSVLKTRNLEEIFRPAYNVRGWVEGLWIGFEDQYCSECAKIPAEVFAANEEQERQSAEIAEAGQQLVSAITAGLHTEEPQGSGSEKYGASDWTQAGQDATGFPVPKGSAEDVTSQAGAGEEAQA